MSMRIIQPKVKDLGAFEVRRAIPQVGAKSVGPWVFFDHFGPTHMQPGQAMDVRPHPHINLATVTYLFAGEIFHRDSLGNARAIQPGAVNLMVAGKGISHSERTPDTLRQSGFDLHGLQLWHALPVDDEEIEPDFLHYAKQDIPQTQRDGVEIRVIMGEGYGLSSPVKTFSPIFYAEANMPAGTSMDLPEFDIVEELAIYPVSGTAHYNGSDIPEHEFAIVESARGKITAQSNARIALIGGSPLGKRHMWWNFISSRPERIEQAKEDWAAGRFGDVPGDDEFIPLPD